MAIGGQGIPIPTATNYATQFPLSPSFASAFPANTFCLPAGGVLLIPPGWYFYDAGAYSTVCIRDPITGVLLPVPGAATSEARTGIINSDGANYYLVNPKGMLVSATVGAAGSGYVQSSTTVTADGVGGSIWHAIVGGAVNATVTIGTDKKGNAGGTNFTLPPTLVASPPPTVIANLPSTAVATGGVQATAICTVSAGAINSVTVENAGAGYTAAPTWIVIPNPLDVNIGSITIPTLTSTLTGAGTVTAVILDYPGTTLASAPTLTVSGAGSSATATANIGIATAALDTVQLQWLGSGA